jgi:hypothetical protein
MQTAIDGAAIHVATMNHLNAPNYILNNHLYGMWGWKQSRTVLRLDYPPDDSARIVSPRGRTGTRDLRYRQRPRESG